jgi:hypothetical protein
MASPMVRKQEQISSVIELVTQVFSKMSRHDQLVFVRALSEHLALKMSPGDRDEWIEKMRKNLDKKTP